MVHIYSIVLGKHSHFVLNCFMLDMFDLFNYLFDIALIRNLKYQAKTKCTAKTKYTAKTDAL